MRENLAWIQRIYNLRNWPNVVLGEVIAHNWLFTINPNTNEVSSPHNEQFPRILTQAPNLNLVIHSWLICTLFCLHKREHTSYISPKWEYYMEPPRSESTPNTFKKGEHYMKPPWRENMLNTYVQPHI